jgi:hypothetical protein
MKAIYKYSMFLLVTTVLAGIFSACDQDAADGGEPKVHYVRVTDPASSDSLLVAAGQGQMIAIMGENLQGAQQLWINDQQAVLTATFVSSRSIIARIPTQIPQVITNEITLVFKNGKTLVHPFELDISEPVIDRMKSEYVSDGEVATFYGNYFYEPLTVTFTGGAVAEIVSVEDQIVEVEVPAGAQPGPVTIASNFGTTESGFWFRDDRNVIASFDGTTGGMWHGPNYIVSSDPNITPIDGKFARLNKVFNAWDWFELWVGPANSDVALELKHIPAEAFSSPENYSLKFELNTLKPLVGAHIRMYIGPDMAGERGNTYYNWQPNINTNGEWQTVSIPWDDVYVANKEFAYNANGYGVSIHFSGPNAFTADFGLDNLRVVPNTTE